MRNQTHTILRELAVVVPLFGLLIAALMLVAASALPAEEVPDAAKVVIGKNLFRSYCASCHGVGSAVGIAAAGRGDKAEGDGSIAEYLRVSPTNLTVLARENEGVFPFEAVTRKIDGRDLVPVHGSDMPIWGDALQLTEGGADEDRTQDKIDALTHFLRSIQVDDDPQ